MVCNIPGPSRFHCHSFHALKVVKGRRRQNLPQNQSKQYISLEPIKYVSERYIQVSLGGIEELAKRKEDIRVATGLPASYELQCPPQQPTTNERTPAPHTPPPGTDSDSNGEIVWDRSEEEMEQPPRAPKLRPKVR